MMKKYVYILIGLASLGMFFTNCSNDYDDERNANVAVIGVLQESNKKYISIKDNETLQLEVFFTPLSAESKVTYSLTGTQSGAIEITPDGLITPKVTVPAEGDIPSPLGIDTIMVSVDNNTSIFVKYPVRVMSHIVLVTSITMKGDGQAPEIAKGHTFDLSGFLTISPTTASDMTVSYSSSDPAIATVDAKGVVTAVGNVGETATITITSNDRAKKTATSIVTIVGEAALYVENPITSSWVLSSNLATKEGKFENLFDDKASTFWAPAIEKRPIYTPACYLDIDMGASIKFGQFGYRHRNLNYPHLQCHTFSLQVKKNESDSWTDLGEFVTEQEQVVNYQLYAIDPVEARYIRVNFIKGHLRTGKTDWDYTEDGNVSVGDLQIFIYNR